MEDLPKALLDRYRLQVGVFLILAILIGGGVLAWVNSGPKPPEIKKIEGVIEATASSTPIPTPTKIKIDIAGAIVNPGVYELPKDSRVEDALNAAGGLSDQADRDWVAKNLNLAAKLHDGDKLYIPRVGETSRPSTTQSQAKVPSAGVVSGAGLVSRARSSNCSCVNINTASAGTLDECLSGVGPSIAQRIVEYREAHGGFRSIEEIQEVRGIGPKTFEKIRDQITVD